MDVSRDYETFLASKAVHPEPSGFEPTLGRAPHLFAFQVHVVDWALRRGRAAVFADCGLGKTAIQLEWARHVVDRSGPVLILAPLAVAPQTVREGARWGVVVRYALDQEDAGAAPIVITNYERLDRFDLTRFCGVVLDESSILKSFMGKTKRELVERCAAIPYRLACTATPAPNDHMELGNHAEFLGVMSSHEMLARWFLNDTKSFGTYRLKGHAVESFWDWVGSWAMCCATPSDLGYSDDGYALPPLEIETHIVDVDLETEDLRPGELFRLPDLNATGLHREKRRTVEDRAARVSEIVAAEPRETWLIWCDTNYEADALRRVLPSSVEVRGSQSRDRKERAALDFVDGKTPVLISKPKLFGFGLNFQHCARVAFIGTSYSYESFYQAVRRTWRFGQPRPVHVHVVVARTEYSVWSTLMAKREGHDAMRCAMSDAVRRAAARTSALAPYQPTRDLRVPAWLREAS